MRRKGRLPGIRRAVDFRSRLLGLMGKNRWPPGYSGLFFPDCASLHTFFTTLGPDLLFLDKSRKILKIIPNASPWKVFFGPSGCCHCLELPGGKARRLGLSPGTRLEF